LIFGGGSRQGFISNDPGIEFIAEIILAIGFRWKLFILAVGHGYLPAIDRESALYI